MGPHLHHRQSLQALGILDAAVLPGLLQAVQAEVAAAALEQGATHGRAHHLGQAGQVAPEQLVLQGLGGGGEQYPFAAEQGGDQIRVGLAHARAGLDHQRPALLQGLCHCTGHVQLPLPRGIAVPGMRQQALGPKGAADLGDERQAASICHGSERQLLLRRRLHLRVFRHAGSSGTRDHSRRVI